MTQQLMSELAITSNLKVKSRMLKVQIGNSWQSLDSQAVLLVPQPDNSFECAGMIKFAKFPMHEGVAILFAAIWEFEAQTNDSIITRQK